MSLSQIDYISNQNYGKYRFGDQLDTYTTTNKVYLNEDSIKDYKKYQESVNEKLKSHTFDIGPYNIPKNQVYLTSNQQKYGYISSNNKQNTTKLPQIEGNYYLKQEKNKVIQQMDKSPNASVSNAVYDNKFDYPKDDVKLDHKLTNHEVNFEQFPHKKLLNNKPVPHQTFDKKSYKKYNNNSQVLLGNDKNQYFLSIAKQQQQDIVTPAYEYQLRNTKNENENENKQEETQQSENQNKKIKTIEIQHSSPHKYGEDNVGKAIQSKKEYQKQYQSQNHSPENGIRQQKVLKTERNNETGSSLPVIIPLKKQFKPEDQKEQIVNSYQNPYKKNFFLEQEKNLFQNKYTGIQSSYQYYNKQRQQFAQNNILYGNNNNRYNNNDSKTSQYDQQRKQQLQVLSNTQKEIQTIRKPQLDDLISQQTLKKKYQQSQLQNQWQQNYEFDKYKQTQKSGLSYLKERQKMFNQAKQPSIPEANNDIENE